MSIVDSDGDGLSDGQELSLGTDPNDADSDDDGVRDGDEQNLSADTDGDGLINALDPDSDNDGLFDGTELGLNCDDIDTDVAAGNCTPDGDSGATTTSPLDSDSDDGGVSDGGEGLDKDGVVDPGETDPNNGTDDNDVDTDGDGLTDTLEIDLGTDPTDGDSDNDGVPDGDEPSPGDDTDGDGIINALDPDSDGDGISDAKENELGTDPNDPDMDDDGLCDGPSDVAGVCVSGEDLNGDGIDDIVVGADQSDAMGESNRGSVYVLRGGAHLAAGGTVDLASFGTTSLAGDLARLDPPTGSTNFHLGGTVQIADLDGNGRAEVLAAATINRAGASIEAVGQPPGSAQGSGGAPHGELFIVWDDNFPQTPWAAGYTIDVGAAPGRQTRMVGETFNISFGEEILGGLDYDGNGQADLFVGDLVADGTAAQNRPSSGLGHIIFDAADLADLDVDMQSPPPELRIHRILGPGDGAISSDTAAHGDFDHDGFADLAFASPHASPEGRTSAGAVHVLFGRQGGWPLLIDLLPGQQPTPDQVRFTEIQGANGTVGSDTGDTLGYSAAAGDIDGDGTVDLIINEMVGNGQTAGAVDVGNLILINGLAIGSGLFVDGFESGSTAAWSSTFP